MFKIKDGLSLGTTVIIESDARINWDKIKSVPSFALIDSPAFTGTPTAPTAASGTNTTQLATTAFVKTAIDTIATGVTSFNTRTGAVTLSSADVTNALAYTPANKAGDTFTGTLNLHSSYGTNGFTNGTGDFADYTTHNFRLSGWYGMGFYNPTTGGTYPQQVSGVLNFREGILDMKGGFRVNGVNAINSAGKGLVSNRAVATDGMLRIVNPDGASYSTGTSTITGAFKITLPVFKSTTMMRMTVKIYEYAGGSNGTSRTIELGGYNYNDAGATWYNMFAYQDTMGGGEINVRFGHDGAKHCIWIGELNTAWSYPQVTVTDFQGGYGGHTEANFATGWSIAPVTAFDTVQTTLIAAKPLNTQNYGNYVVPSTGGKFTGSVAVGNHNTGVYPTATSLLLGSRVDGGVSQLTFESRGQHTGHIAMTSTGNFHLGMQGNASFIFKTGMTYDGDGSTTGTARASITPDGTVRSHAAFNIPAFQFGSGSFVRSDGTYMVFQQNGGGSDKSFYVNGFNRLYADNKVQVNGNIGGGNVDPTYGLHMLGGGIRLQAVATPAAPTVTNVGTTGTTTHDYYIVAEDRNGKRTLASAVGRTTTGNAVLDATNYNTVSWGAVSGAVKYYVYFGNTSNLLATTTATTVNHTGQAASTLAAPTRNETADAIVDGNIGVGTTSLTTYGGYAGITLRDTGGGHITIRDNAGGVHSEIAADAGGTTVKTVSGHPLRFGTSNAERMRIHASGRVAIGTTNDSGALLNVAGGRVDINGTYGNTHLGWDGKDNYFTHRTTGAFYIRRFDGTNHLNPDLTVNGAGNVLIGTTADLGEKFQVNGIISAYAGSGYSQIRVRSDRNTAGQAIGDIQFVGKDSVGNVQVYSAVIGSIESPTDAAEAGNLRFFTATAGASTEKARVTSNGNVLIGRTSNLGASSLLEVNGQAILNTATPLANSNVPALDIQGSWIRLGDQYAASTMSDGCGLKLHDSGVGHWSVGMSPTNQFSIATTGAAGGQLFPTGANYALNVVYSNGNVLIGTTADNGNKLQVAGTVTATGATFTGTGSVKLPVGTNAQRPTGVAGDVRFNNDLKSFEGHNGTAWDSIGGGAKGGVGNSVFYENDTTITQSYTIGTNKNAMTAGPITINDGVVVTVPDGSVWTVV